LKVQHFRQIADMPLFRETRHLDQSGDFARGAYLEGKAASERVIGLRNATRYW
jgi:hypothetical protein